MCSEERCLGSERNQVSWPTRDEAEALLAWAHARNPGAWREHSRVVARAAQAIAEKCRMDGERAYVSGLLHDIGRYEGVRGLHHVYAGWALMHQRGYPGIAAICMSHSFPVRQLGAYSGKADCTAEELAVMAAYLAQATYDDLERLIQLCDAISSAQGVCLMEVRLMDVLRRHGLNDFSGQKIEGFFALKTYFDTLCGMNIYELFSDEIRETLFN